MNIDREKGRGPAHIDCNKRRLKQPVQSKTLYDNGKFRCSLRGDSQATIRPTLKTTLTHTPSRRILELACPNPPYFTFYGSEPFHFIKRSCSMREERSSSCYEDVISLMPTLKQIEATRPTARSFISFQETRQKEKQPKLITFHPEPEKKKVTCSKRLCALAQPRQNRMELRKKQMEQERKVYTVSKSAMKAIPSNRIIALARPKTAKILEHKSKRETSSSSTILEHKKQVQMQTSPPSKKIKQQQQDVTTYLDKKEYPNVYKVLGKHKLQETMKPVSGKEKPGSSNISYIKNIKSQKQARRENVESSLNNNLKITSDHLNLTKQDNVRKGYKLAFIIDDAGTTDKENIKEKILELHMTTSEFTDSSDLSSLENGSETLSMTEEMLETLDSESLSTTESVSDMENKIKEEGNQISMELVIPSSKKKSYIIVVDDMVNDRRNIDTNKYLDEILSAEQSDHLASVASKILCDINEENNRDVKSKDIKTPEIINEGSAVKSCLAVVTVPELDKTYRINTQNKTMTNIENVSKLETEEIKNAENESEDRKYCVQEYSLKADKQLLLLDLMINKDTEETATRAEQNNIQITTETRDNTKSKRQKQSENRSLTFPQEYLNNTDTKRKTEKETVDQDFCFSTLSEDPSVLFCEERIESEIEKRNENLSSLKTEVSTLVKSSCNPEENIKETDHRNMSKKIHERKLSYLTTPPLIPPRNPSTDNIKYLEKR